MDMLNQTPSMKWIRRIVAFGLLAYLASFFFLGSSAQKTLFYLLVAAPSIILFIDLPRLLRREHRVPTLFVLIFVTYFALSSLWSSEGTFANGLKLALCIICLLLAIHSTMSMRNDSELLFQHFILIVGTCAASLYLFFFIGDAFRTTEHSTLLANRYTLRMLSGQGDGNPINSAMYFGLVVLAAWWTFPHRSPWEKLGLLVSIGASVTIMLITQSRGPLLSLVVVLALTSALRRSRDDLALWGLASVAGLAAVISFNLAPQILDRAGSPSYRFDIWRNAIELIKANLFFGQGLGEAADIPFLVDGHGVVTVGHSHSSVLETFRVGGLVGGFSFLAMVLAIACRSLRLGKGNCFFVFWLVYGLLCLSTNGRLPFIRPSIEWFAFWVPLFLVLFSPGGTGTGMDNHINLSQACRS